MERCRRRARRHNPVSRCLTVLSGSRAMRELGRRRQAQLTPEQRKELGTEAVNASWSKTTAEERSLQAKERWRRNKQKEAVGKRARQRKKPSRSE